ncbi:hypothetical protein PF003_g4588 [Phytophthora fragariae]|nr:hypothetical protein PF003_g4588 [Phytophthora fragariae]
MAALWRRTPLRNIDWILCVLSEVDETVRRVPERRVISPSPKSTSKMWETAA